VHICYWKTISTQTVCRRSDIKVFIAVLTSFSTRIFKRTVKGILYPPVTQTRTRPPRAPGRRGEARATCHSISDCSPSPCQTGVNRFKPASSRQRHDSSPFAYGPLDPRQSLAFATIKTDESVDRRQFATDRSERNMKTYQISDDRLIVVKKNPLVIKQKESDKSFEFTPSRSVPYMFVTKYCSRV